jgi:hypothetical protein
MATKAPNRMEELLEIVIPAAIILPGIIIFIYQSYIFLRYDNFIIFSIIDAMKIINDHVDFYRDWTLKPKDWIGLHRVFSWIPLAPALVFSGVYVANNMD